MLESILFYGPVGLIPERDFFATFGTTQDENQSAPGAPPTPGDRALVVVIGDNHSGSQDGKEEEQECN
jgi:hypothetical protein